MHINNSSIHKAISIIALYINAYQVQHLVLKVIPWEIFPHGPRVDSEHASLTKGHGNPHPRRARFPSAETVGTAELVHEGLSGRSKFLDNSVKSRGKWRENNVKMTVKFDQSSGKIRSKFRENDGKIRSKLRENDGNIRCIFRGKSGKWRYIYDKITVEISGNIPGKGGREGENRRNERENKKN